MTSEASRFAGFNAGTTPNIADGVARLDHLGRHGPSPHAFTFKRRFPPEEAAAGVLAASPAE